MAETKKSKKSKKMKKKSNKVPKDVTAVVADASAKTKKVAKKASDDIKGAVTAGFDKIRKIRAERESLKAKLEDLATRESKVIEDMHAVAGSDVAFNFDGAEVTLMRYGKKGRYVLRHYRKRETIKV